MTTTVSEDMSTDEAPEVCSVPGCDRPVDVRKHGWCMKHYKRWQRHGSTDPTRMANKGKPCDIEDCPNDAETKGLCKMHYNRLLLHGDAGESTQKRGLPIYERAMRMIDTSAGPDACHLWTGTVSGSGRMPRIADGPRKKTTSRSVRRVIAEHHGLATDYRAVRMREDCDPLCCNIKHMWKREEV